MLGCLSTVILIGMSVAAAFEYFSIWWLGVPIFFAASFSIVNSPQYDGIIRANLEGNLWLFPVTFAIHSCGYCLLATATFWLTRVLI
jgi:hypothetical protein